MKPMLRSIFFLCLLIPFSSFAQQLTMNNGVYCLPNGEPYTGQYVAYYPSGTKAAVYNLVDGVFHNTVTYYRESGSIDYTGAYYHGKKDGLWCSLDERGRVVSKIKYRKGQKTGEWFVRGAYANEAYLLYFANDELLSSRKLNSREAHAFTRR